MKLALALGCLGVLVAPCLQSAELPLDEGFANPPSHAYPGGSLGVSSNAQALQAQIERQRQNNSHFLGIGTPQGAYLSDGWKQAIASTASAAATAGFELSFLTSPGFSHTGDSRVQPQEAMKKLVWTETRVPGGKKFAGKLAAPPDNSGPYQNIPYFNESPWTIAIDRAFYQDVAVVAYRVAVDETAAAQPIITSSNGPIDAARLTANDPRNPVSIDSRNGAPWLQLEYSATRTVRSAVLATPETLFEGSLLAELSARRADGTWTRIAKFDMRSTAQVTRTFPAVTASAFRFEFSRLPLSVEPLVPKSADDAPVASGNLPFGAKRPPGTIAINTIALLGNARVNEAERKAGFFTFANDYYALATDARDVNALVARSDVIDLTARMRADGTLDWQPPAGNWRVLRIGWSLTGKINHPAPPDASGLEVDKLSAKHMSSYLARYLDGFLPQGDARRGITGLFADSIESGPQTWTDEMFEEFRKRRGYDLRPYMPALTGVVVDSAEATDKFLWDWRQTIADLIHENTYATIARMAHARGLTTRVQALEQARHQLGDDFEMRRDADQPMGALWASADPVVDYLKDFPNQVADLRGAASVAHVYGRRIVAAESGTTLSFPGAFSPRVLKQIVDLEFGIGVNWLGRGAPSARDLWAPYASDWLRYLARTSWLLQQGRYVADVAYFYGQDAPLVALRERLADTPRENGFDFINAPALLNSTSVRDGRLVLASGMQYRVLQLGGSSRMLTLPVLRRLHELVSQGLIVAGAAPLGTPSLADDAAEFRRLRDGLWGADGNGVTLGTGRVFGTSTIAEVLAQVGVAPDVSASPGTVGDTYLFQHRALDTGELYFVANRSGRGGPVEFTFRQNGKAPELWRATTGEKLRPPYRHADGRTTVGVEVAPNDAFFVVFREDSQGSQAGDARPVRTTLLELDGPWSVTFKPARGDARAPVDLSVGSWSDSNDNSVRYFSGTATYARSIDVPKRALRKGTRFLLDLGEVQDIAEVRVNGQLVAVRWTPPYEFDVTSALKAGSNALEIKVTNREVNALIGAAQARAAAGPRPAAPAGAAPDPGLGMPAFGGYKPDAAPRAAGLIGPVSLDTQEMTATKKR